MENQVHEEMKNTEAEEIKEEIQEETAAEEAKEEVRGHKEKDKKREKKPEARIAELEKELNEVQKKYEESNDKYLRMMAEYDNFRKRSAKEKDSAWTDAYSDCIENILPVLDNLERATAFDQLDAVKKGLEMTVKTFTDALKKMGIEEVETESFDPNLHNAVMHVEDENYGESAIVEVFQKGYRKGDKIIRYAMVKVAN